MNICLINNLYKPFKRGGAEEMTENMAQSLLNKGHIVSIITTKPRFLNAALGMKTDNHVNISYLPSLYWHLNKSNFFLKLVWHLCDLFNLVNFIKIKIKLKSIRPKLIITNNLQGIGLLLPLLIRREKISQVHILHDIQLIHPSGLMLIGEEKKIDTISAKIYYSISRLLFGSPRLIISPSAWLLKMHRDRGFFLQSKIVVMPNPMPPIKISSKINRAQITLNNKSDKFNFLFIGQLEIHKGILLLVKAFMNLNRKIANCRLCVAGKGSALSLAKSLAGGGENIIFTGWQNEEQLNNLMETSDCLIVPSICYENSPTVIYQAFNNKLPILGSKLAGIEELLENGRGTFFKAGDEDDLIKKMEWEVKNKDYAKEIASRKLKKTSVTTEQYLEKILALSIK